MVAFTSKDVARVAGVSQSTVSYVMTGKRPISKTTRERVLAAMQQLTYEPHAGARALAGRRTRVIGLVVPFGTASDKIGLLPFIETIASTARSNDHEVLLVTADEGSAGLRRLAGRALCDAIIVMDVEARDERVPVAASLPVPVVLVGVPDDPAGLHCVDVDFAGAAIMAVDELAATGHDHVVIIGYPAATADRQLNFVHRFLDAALEACAAHGMQSKVLAPVEPGRVAAAEAVDAILDRHMKGRPALLVPHTAAIQPLLHALTVRGVVPGRDISVIGLSTDADAEDAEPTYTNVSLEPRDVSRRAMTTLFSLLDPAAGAQLRQIDLVSPRLTRRHTVMATPQPAAEPARR